MDAEKDDLSVDPKSDFSVNLGHKREVESYQKKKNSSIVHVYDGVSFFQRRELFYANDCSMMEFIRDVRDMLNQMKINSNQKEMDILQIEYRKDYPFSYIVIDSENIFKVALKYYQDSGLQPIFQINTAYVNHGSILNDYFVYGKSKHGLELHEILRLPSTGTFFNYDYYYFLIIEIMK